MKFDDYLKGFIVVDGDVMSVIEIGDSHFVNAAYVFTVAEPILFDSREEAMYSKLLQELTCGTPLKNYKSSKYYRYYLKRLAEDNPEYLI